MAFILDDIIAAALISAAGTAYASANSKVKSNTQQTGQAAGGQTSPAQSVFTSGYQKPSQQAQLKPIENPQLDTMAAYLSTLGDPPLRDPGMSAVTADANATAAKIPNMPIGPPKTSIGEILAATPAAMNAASALLGLDANREKRTVVGSPTGGPQGQMVQGFQLPSTPRMSLGQLLASLPKG